MRQLLFTIIFTLVVVWAFGQRIVEKSIEIGKNSTLKLDLDFADSIKVTQSSSNNLLIKVVVDINDNQHNDKYELKESTNGDYLTVKGVVNDLKSIKVPYKSKNGSRYFSDNHGCVEINIYYEIQVPKVEKFSIKTISGDITITQLEMPMKIESISGFIDFSISKKSNADILIQTITGEVFTNHEINKDVDECKTNPASTKLRLKLNSGSTPIELKTISSDIYLRKI